LLWRAGFGMKKRQHEPCFTIDFSTAVLLAIMVLALGRDLIANGRPLYCRINGEAFFPGLRSVWCDPAFPYGHPVLDSIQRHFLWRLYPYDAAVFAPIAFSPGELPTRPDTTVRQALPGARHPLRGERVLRHWLGTDAQGYDVAAGLVGGARVAVQVGSLATCLAFGVGVLLGAFAGYWGDDRLRLSRGTLIALLLALPVAVFYAQATAVVLSHFSALGRLVAAVCAAGVVMVLAERAGRWLGRWPFLERTVVIPVDLIIMRLAEAFLAVPGLLAVIAFAALLREQTQTLWAMIALVGLFSWPGVALFVRAEMLRVREMDYITAARSLGMSSGRILLRHALPNALQAAYTVFALGVANAILLEASLSFLGYGSQHLSGATWGSLLQNARTSPHLWWVSLPPGLAICLTVMALQLIGDRLGTTRRPT
jgi:peptide/nickel transport system permease protein